MRIKTWKLFTEDLYIDDKGKLREPIDNFDLAVNYTLAKD